MIGHDDVHGIALHCAAPQSYEAAKDEEGPVEASMLRIICMRLWWYAWYAWGVWIKRYLPSTLRASSPWHRGHHTRCTIHQAEWEWSQGIIKQYL